MSVIRALLLRISIMFHEYLRSTWAPSTILLLREETKDYRQRERLLGHPRADAFRPASTPPQSGPDALHTKDEIIKLAMGRATEMFEEATSDIMGVMTEEVLQVRILCKRWEINVIKLMQKLSIFMLHATAHDI